MCQKGQNVKIIQKRLKFSLFILYNSRLFMVEYNAKKSFSEGEAKW